MSDEPLLPDVKRITQGRFAWFLACLLVATSIWSFAWNPVLFLYEFTVRPPENINGSFAMGYVVCGLAALSLFLSLVVGGQAFRDYLRPNYGVLLLLLAGTAVVASLIGMEVYASIPVLETSS